MNTMVPTEDMDDLERLAHEIASRIQAHTRATSGAERHDWRMTEAHALALVDELTHLRRHIASLRQVE
jgi:hypothetical protein